VIVAIGSFVLVSRLRFLLTIKLVVDNLLLSYGVYLRCVPFQESLYKILSRFLLLRNTAFMVRRVSFMIGCDFQSLLGLLICLLEIQVIKAAGKVATTNCTEFTEGRVSSCLHSFS